MVGEWLTLKRLGEFAESVKMTTDELMDADAAKVDELSEAQSAWETQLAKKRTDAVAQR